MPSPAAMRQMPHMHGGWPPPPRGRYREQQQQPRDSRLPPRPHEIPSKRPAPSSSSYSPGRGPPPASNAYPHSYSHHVPIPLPAKPRLSASPSVSSSSQQQHANAHNRRRRSPSARSGLSRSDPKPAQGPLLAEAQWLYAPAELQATPSVRDGMALEKERELRLKGTNFILQVGIALKLPQLTLSTAAVFFNRFLMRRSLVAKGGVKPLHHYEIAATSIFLATKVEETCRKMKEIVIACCRVAQKNPTLLVDEQTKDFWRWRDTILLNEDVLLETICFDLTVESPHKILYDMLKQLGAAHAKPLRSAAWSFLNDSTTTQLCLLFPSRAIAAAALYCAAKHCSFAFPDDKVGRPWWEVMHVSLRDIKRACNYMADVYIERRGSGSTVGTSAVSGDSTNVGDGSGASEGNAGGDGSGRNSIYVGLHTPEDGDNRSTKTRQQRQRSSSPTGTNSGCAKRARDDEGGDEDGEVVVKRDRHAENNESKGYNDHDGKTADKPTRRHSLGPDRDKDKDIDRDGNWNGDQDNQIRGRARPSEHDANDDERHRKRQRTASTSAGGISLPDNERAADGRGGEWPESGGVSISGAGAGAGAGAGTGDAATSMKDEEEVGSEDGEVEG